MPRTSPRGGPQTRARIREVANRLFSEHGFDAVTVAEVARQAEVSSVTVFNHFPRKEDLFLDRPDEAVELLRSAVRDRPADVDVLESLRRMTLDLVDARHPLSGADPRSVDFFRTVAGSPSLVARAREISAELQAGLATELEADARFGGDAGLLAAYVLAGYGAVMVGTARRMLAGESADDVLDDHRARFERLYADLRHGVRPDLLG